MHDDAPGRDATSLLRDVAGGDDAARSELLSLLYDELHRLARRHMAGQSAAHTLQPTALVHEAWVRLAGADANDFRDRRHFLAFASRAMRSVLVDHARARRGPKRGGDRQRVPLDATLATYEERGHDVLAVDEALARLEADEPDLAALVELRFFGGLAMNEAAEVLDVSLSTVERRWRLARVWLREALATDDEA